MTTQTRASERDLHKDETGSLISADKVEGTPVYDPNGDKIGTVDKVMIDKRSGQVPYAVMSFGGFLGIGDSYHPLPWNVLDYDTAKGGYVVNVSRQQLEGAPTFERTSEPDWNDAAYGRRIHDYYGVTPFGIPPL